MSKTQSIGINRYFFEQLRALVISLIITFVLVLLSALIIKIFSIPTEYICIINQIIKGVAVFLSALFSFRLPSKGFIRGIIHGIVYILVTFVLFSVLGGSFSFGISLLNDITLGAITGLLSGIFAVNVRK
ncbi:MAG: TIGR04086 family membrane protein [Clostridia bacterium]|nr:TIGR04086 family membrane protein [Clostridia bacterium]MBQ7224545.1 TIGR04086 family membrane protein [Clostridia bacterium]